MGKLYFFLIFLSFLAIDLSANDKVPGKADLLKDAKIDAVNKYVEFINESIHGMFLVNRLLVEYNMELNKYVDLENEKINNYSNRDLPKDIFEDKEHWFYDVSPYELLDQAKIASEALEINDKTNLNLYANKILSIIKAANDLRFAVDNLTTSSDLTKRENVEKVYKKLQEGVKLFEDFYTNQKEMEKIFNQNSTRWLDPKSIYRPSYNSMVQIQTNAKLILEKIRYKDTEHLDQFIMAYNRALIDYKSIDISKLTSVPSISMKLQSSFTNSLNSANEIEKLANAFLQNQSIPSKYKLYGRNYYYYNVEMISKNNKYGSGLVFEINNMIHISELPLIKLTELPHIFQIIYPKKIDNQEIIKASDQIVAIPTVVKERIVTKNKIMRVDNKIVELQLYDHMIADGDVVSINFNGDWILEKEELERGSKTIKLLLNADGKNFILLHADNVGKRPPNTMAISYLYHGQKKEIILKSDENKSELIEIVFEK